MSFDLLINAIVAGLLLGGFYAAVTAGVSISFGMLDIVNIAHPAFIILGSYIAYIVNTKLRLRSDPCQHPHAAGVLRCSAPASIRSTTCRSRSAARNRCAASPSSSASLFITEVVLILVFGVDYRYVEAPYIGPTWHLGFDRLPAAHAGAVPGRAGDVRRAAALPVAHLHRPRRSWPWRRTSWRLRLMAANPIRIKRIAFGVSIATAALAGALLIIIQPVEPSVGREYIGRVFAICVLGGLGSLPGTRDRGACCSACREPHGDLLRPLVGARGVVRLPAAHAGRPAGRLPRALSRERRAHAFILAAFADRRRRGVLRRSAASAIDYLFFAGYVVLQYIVLGDGLEYPRRLCRLREFRHRRRSSPSAPTRRCSAQSSVRLPIPVLIAGRRDRRRRGRASAWAISRCACAARSSPSPRWRWRWCCRRCHQLGLTSAARAAPISSGPSADRCCSVPISSTCSC